MERISDYSTIPNSELNPTIFRASESDFSRSNTYPALSDLTFSEFRINLKKIARYLSKIFDFLGIHILLGIWNFKLSEPIWIRLFDIGWYSYPTFWYPLHHYILNMQNANVHFFFEKLWEHACRIAIMEDFVQNSKPKIPNVLWFWNL